MTGSGVQFATAWVQAHLGALVSFGNDLWQIDRLAQCTGTDVVVLRSPDGERVRIESPRRVEASFRSENS